MNERPINSFKDLLVWQAAMNLAVSSYLVTREFPRSEVYGLVSQIRRAASSVPANIAEGHGRENTGSFVQFLRIAQGSLKELETHFILASKVGLLSEPQWGEIENQMNEVGRMLRSLIRSLQSK